MKWQLQLVGHGPVVFETGLPKNWNGKVLPGSEAFFYRGEAAHITVQQYPHEQWCMRYVVLRFFRKIILHWREEAALYMRFVLNGDLRYKGDRTGYHVKAGYANIAWAPGRETFARFTKGKEYVFFQLQYAPGLVQELWPLFPKVSLPSERKCFSIEREWHKTILDILDAPYDENTLRFYYENKVRDILLFMLVRPGSGMKYEGLTEEEVQKVRLVDAMILTDLTKWLSIPRLAKEVHLTQFKLKLAYKKVIGMNMFERLRNARLEKGRKLLLETNLQIKVIYSEVGYKSLSGFEDAFKEKFGLPPLQYRQHHQPTG